MSSENTNTARGILTASVVELSPATMTTRTRTAGTSADTRSPTMTRVLGSMFPTLPVILCNDRGNHRRVGSEDKPDYLYVVPTGGGHATTSALASGPRRSPSTNHTHLRRCFVSASPAVTIASANHQPLLSEIVVVVFIFAAYRTHECGLVQLQGRSIGSWTAGVPGLGPPALESARVTTHTLVARLRPLGGMFSQSGQVARLAREALRRRQLRSRVPG